MMRENGMHRVRLLFASVLALGSVIPVLAQARDLEITAFGGYNPVSYTHLTLPTILRV